MNSTDFPQCVPLAALLLLATSHGVVQANPYDCQIEANQIVEIRSSVEGLIDKVLVKRGDQVRAGQVLAQLESSAEISAVELARYRSEAGGRIASATNRLDYATKKLERSQELQAQNFVTAQARDEAEAERKITESDLRDAKENREVARHEYRHAQDLLNRRTLRSPFNGVVLDRMLNPGDLAEAGTGRKPVLKLAQIDRLRVDIVLPSALGGKVKPGARVVVVAHGGVRHQATVRLVDKVVDAASGTLVARAELPNPTGDVLSGVRCKAEFDPAIEPNIPRGAALSAR